LRLLAPKILKKNIKNQPTNIEISNNRDEKKIEKDHHLKKEKRAERNYHYPIQQKTTIIMIMISVFCPNSQ